MTQVYDEPREVHDRRLDDVRERLRLIVLRDGVFTSFDDERHRQIVKWGNQKHRDGTGGRGTDERRDMYQALCDARSAAGKASWLDILLEEVYEAGAEMDEKELEVELVQVGAVVTAWLEDLRSRSPRA